MKIKHIKLEKKYYIAMACKVIEAAVSFIVSILISRGLGPAVKGDYAYIIEMVNILYVIFGMALGQSYATYRRSKGLVAEKLFIELIFSQSFLALFLGIFVFIITRNTTILIVSGLTAISVSWFNISMLAVIEDSIKRNVLVTCINTVEALVLLVLFITHTCTLTTALIVYGATKVAVVISIFIIYKFKIQFVKIDFEEIKEIYKIASVTMVVVLLISVNYRIDVVMLKNLSSSYETGIYSVAGTISNLFLLVPDAFKEVLFGDSAKGQFKKSTKKSIITSIGISTIILLAFFVFGRWALNIFYGEEYAPSYMLTIILWFGTIPLTLFKILQPIYIAIGQQKVAALYLTLSAVTNIIVNWLLIPSLGGTGAALATVTSYSVCGFLFLIYYKRKIETNAAFDQEVM